MSVYGMTTEWRERFTHRSRAGVHDKRPVSGLRSARLLLAVPQYPGNPGSKDDAVLEDCRAVFCARLKSSRERKGVSLEEIAASTKISRSLLKGLEENDLSRWPQGLYRRSYLRDYVRAIDLPQEATMAEFVRLFPDGDAISPAVPAIGAAEGAGESCSLSMTFDDGRIERLARVRKRITGAAIDLVAVLVVSTVVWWSLHVDLPVSVAVVALGYYTIGTAALGYGLGLRLLENRSWRRPKKPSLPAVPSLQDTLLERMREVKGISAQPEPAMAGGILGMLIVTIIRTLFLR